MKAEAATATVFIYRRVKAANVPKDEVACKRRKLQRRLTGKQSEACVRDLCMVMPNDDNDDNAM